MLLKNPLNFLFMTNGVNSFLKQLTLNTGWDGIRQDNGKIADNSSYSFIAKFITYRNQLQKKTGSFLLLK